MNSRNSSTPLLRRTSRWFKAALFGAALALVGTANAQITVPGSHPSLQAAFAAINAGTFTGAVTIDITASYAEPAGSAVLNSSGNGSASYTSVTIRPTGAGPWTITGASVLGRGIIELNGADNVTINGDIAGGSVGRDLTITNTAATTVNLTSVIRVAVLATLAVNGTADNVLISNCNINGNATARNVAGLTSTTNVENSSFGIYAGGLAAATASPTAPSPLTSVSTNTAASGTTINNFTVDNCAVNACARAIFFNGGIATVCAGTLSITNNLVGDQATTLVGNPPYVAPTTTVYTKGIFVAGATNVTITGNSIKNILSYVITLMAGIELNSAIGAGAININSNTINGVVDNNAVNTSSVNGINIASATGSNPINVNSNTVSNIQYSGASFSARAIGINIAAGSPTTASVSRNIVNTVITRSTGTSGAYGINLAAGSNYTCADNSVYDINQDMTGGVAFSTTFGVFGIRVGAGLNHKIYHNSVNLSGSLIGTANSSLLTSCFAITATSLTGCDVRNNLFSNTMTGGTTSIAHTCIFLPSSGTAAMALTLNNNAYYTGSTAGVHGINHVGTTYTAVPAGAATYAGLYTAASFVSGSTAGTANHRFYTSTLGVVANDNASFATTAAAPFTSSTDLHIPAATATQLESGGVAGLSVTTDWDGQTFGTLGTALSPDIGYDEFAGVAVDLTGPVITYTALTNTVSTANRTQSITVTDALSGVPVAGLGLPVIYYRKNLGAYSSNQCTSTGGSGYDCVIDYTPLGGVIATDVIDYYVAAQDGAGTPNVAVNPSAGASGFTANPPAVSTPPTTPTSYAIASLISGTINVGSAETFTSLTRNDAAGLFRYINGNIVNGNITIEVTSDLLLEDGAVALNAFDSPWTVSVKPNGAPRTISGAISANALIRTNGASRFTIDGSTSGGTDRSLTITNTSVTTPQVVRFSSIGVTPITSITLKNCIVVNGVNTSSAVVLTDNAGTAEYFTNITIQNNDIRRAYIGVFANAVVSAGNGSGLLYTQNTLNTAGADAIRLVGLYVQGADGATVSSNTVGNFESASAESDAGIWLATGTGNTTVSGNAVSNLGLTVNAGFNAWGIRESSGLAASGNNITGNTISSIVSNSSAAIAGITCSGGGTTIQRNNIQGVNNTSTGTFGAYGIDISAGNNSVVKNNFVSGVTGDMTGGGAFSFTFGIFGIRVGAGTGHVVANNSVNLFGLRTGTATTALLTAALGIASTASTGLDVRNNILANNITGGTSSCANVAIALPSLGTSAMNLTDNRNSYYFGTDPLAGAGEQGTTSGAPNLATLAALAAYTSTLHVPATNDNASTASTGAVPYASSSDLHITTAATEFATGATIGSVTNDFDGDTRPQGLSYDKGADEVLYACDGTVANAGPDQTVCGSGATLAGNTALIGTGAWTIITGAGGTVTTPASETSGFTGVAGTSYTLRWTITKVDCTPTTDDVVINLTANPTASNAGPDQTVCGTSVTLAANAPSVGTGLWSIISGAGGSVTTPASETSGFTGVAGTSYTLRWTTSNAPCPDSTDDVVINLTANPTASNAGPDQTVCGTSATLAANAPSVGTGSWSIQSGAGGTVTTPASETSGFTGVAGTSYTLRWTISNAPCADATDDVVINLTANPTTATVGGPQTICDLGTTTGLGGNIPSVGTGAWSVVSGGTGSFSNAADENATFTHATGVGPVVVRWTISNAPCAASTADVTITINQPPTTATVGGPQTICQLGTTTGLGGNIPSVGTGAWSVVSGGTGSFSNAADENSTFTHATGVGPVVVRWTISNAPCTASFADVTLTITPATTWYADQDNDTFGDPGTTLLACVQPVGYVANNTDNCPLVFGLIGSICDADPNPFIFALGELNGSCVCAAAVCTQNLVLDFQTDANPSQTSWEIKEQGTNTLVLSGNLTGAPANSNSWPVNVCVPNGCYYLKVMDANGIVNGGYVLRTGVVIPGSLPANMRIIDNTRNFTVGPLSQMSTPTPVDGDFCFGGSNANLTSGIYTSCDKLDWTTGEYYVCSAMPNVSALWNAGNLPAEAISGYEFWFYNPNGGYSFRKFRAHNVSDGFSPDNASRACHIKINNWAAGSQIPANVLMNVRVRSRINGVNGNWGAACRFKIDPVRAACPLTKLMDIPGDPNLSCGSTRAWGAGNYIYARPVSGATQYQWRFRQDGESFITIRTTTTYFIQLNWVTLPLVDGETYQVEVRAFKNGAWCIDTPTPAFCGFVTPCFTAWGTVCDLTIDNTPANGGNENIATSNNPALRMYPNPNRGDQLYLSLDAVEEGVTTVSVDIYDLFGKRVSARTIAVNDSFINTVLDLDGNMASGMYVVNITAGSASYTERLVIQK